MTTRSDQSKAKINAKKFVKDFRSGKTDDELMAAHGLDKQALDKVFRILIQKGFLSQSDLLEGHSFRSIPQEEIEPGEPYRRGPDYGMPPEVARPQAAQSAASQCPQCGASVSAKKLTCHECGHVLPGEDRWADVGAKTGILDRLPPKLLGLLIAIPCALVLLFLFRDVIIPMAHKTVEKRERELTKDWTYGQGALDIAKQMSRGRGHKVVQVELERLFAEGILLGSDANYTTFEAGSRWHLLSDSDKERYLDEIRAAMIQANMEVRFQVVDAGGQPVARVGLSSIELGPFIRSHDPAGTDAVSASPGGAAGDPRLDAMHRALGKKLPHAEPPADR